MVPVDDDRLVGRRRRALRSSATPRTSLFEDITVDGAGGLGSAFRVHHSDSANRNAWNVTIRRLSFSRSQQAIVHWDPTLRNITLASITSTGSGTGQGFYSSLGTDPAGATFVNNSFR